MGALWCNCLRQTQGAFHMMRMVPPSQVLTTLACMRNLACDRRLLSVRHCLPTALTIVGLAPADLNGWVKGDYNSVIPVLIGSWSGTVSSPC